MKYILLGSQHFLSMISATILVPLLTGLPVSVALFSSGIGTLIFHKMTGGKVPAYLGSSFAFIAPITLVVATEGISKAGGGIIVAGLIYVLFSYIVDKINIKRYLPPVVVAPIIMIIGLTLAPVAIDQAMSNLFLAIITMAVTIFLAIYCKGFLKLIPVIGGLVIGYLVALVTGNVDLEVTSAIISFPDFVFPSFSISSISIIAPVAIVTMIEHIGDIFAIEKTIEKDIVGEVGLNNTIKADGVATMFAGLIGSPPNTTYGENTGVLALTGAHDSRVVQIGAVMAVLLSFIPNVSNVIMSVPDGVLGGISIILYGMIVAIGARTLVENNVDLNKQRNLIIVSVILIIGLGGTVFNVGIEISELAVASIVGILLNAILPE